MGAERDSETGSIEEASDEGGELPVLRERLRISQKRFEKVFHGNAAAMVIASQSDLRIIDVNPRWLTLFGATREEVLGHTTLELGLITAHNAQARIAEHSHNADGVDSELQLFTRDGRAITVLASARPIVIEEGPCTLTTLIDVTDHRRTEEAFALAFNASPAGMILVEADSEKVVAANARLLEMTGLSPAQLLGHAVGSLDLIREPARIELLAEIARSGGLDAVEVVLARHDAGAAVTALLSSETVTLSGKSHRLSVFTDITARKRFERRLLTQHEVARLLAEKVAGNNHLEVTLSHVLERLCRDEGWASGAVWLPTADGTLELSATWHELGVARDSQVASLHQRVRLDGGTPMALRMVTLVESDALGMRRAALFPISAGEQKGVVTLTASDAAAADDNDGRMRGLFDAVGRMLGLFVERARADRALQELNADLERRVRARTQALETSNRDLELFSSSVSHDLRAPLRGMTGFAAILLEDFGAVLPPEAQELIRTIVDSGNRMRDLIEDLLEYSRLGLSQLKRSSVDLDALVRGVLDELLTERSVAQRLELRLDALGTCQADAPLLRSVWTNLIDNALKYSRTRDRMVIEIGRREHAGECVYYVRDNGVGFDMKEADRLFGMFQRLHTASDFDGNGVGLASVRRIVERHQGSIRASSEVGRGSTFEFTLGP